MSGPRGALTELVVGVDGTPSSDRAFRWACAQADGGSVTGVYAFSPVTALLAAGLQIELDDTRERDREALQTTWTSPEEHPAVDIDTAVIDDEPAAALELVAGRRDGSVIVIGHDDVRTSAGSHIGAVATRLLHDAVAPVIIVTPDTSIEAMSGPVVASVHGATSADEEPVRFATDIAMRRGLPLRLVAVAEPMLVPPATGTIADATLMEEERQARRASALRLGQRLADEVAERCPSLDVSLTVLDGHPTTSISAELAVCGASLAVIGNHHHSTLASIVNGSVTRYLPAVSPCPVAAVPVR